MRAGDVTLGTTLIKVQYTYHLLQKLDIIMIVITRL